MTARKKTQRCANCGGSNVLLDAYAFWNDETQDWELAHSFDDARCDDCDGETEIVERWLDTGEPVGEGDRYNSEKFVIRDIVDDVVVARIHTREIAESWVSHQADPDRYAIEPPELVTVATTFAAPEDILDDGGMPLIDLDDRAHALMDEEVRHQRDIQRAREEFGITGPVAFFAAHDAVTADEDEIVYRSAPRWAWEIMDETLAMDATSKAFDQSLRESISAATKAMILSCERGDDAPISREEAGEGDEAEG